MSMSLLFQNGVECVVNDNADYFFLLSFIRSVHNYCGFLKTKFFPNKSRKVFNKNIFTWLLRSTFTIYFNHGFQFAWQPVSQWQKIWCSYMQSTLDALTMSSTSKYTFLASLDDPPFPHLWALFHPIRSFWSTTQFGFWRSFHWQKVVEIAEWLCCIPVFSGWWKIISRL